MVSNVQPLTESGATLSDRAYEQLKHDIVRGDLPPGTRLAVRQLSQSYDIGASPIREALHRLVGEGLVLAIGQRGFRVPPIEVEDLWDVTRTRVLVETQALRESIERGDDAWEAGVVAAYHQLEKSEQSPERDFAEWERRNQAFHEALVAASESRWLKRLRDILHDQHRRYRYLSQQYTQGPSAAAEEHRALREAALKRDADAACKVMREHIEHTARNVEPILSE